jgi:calcineurin-like phosphoesterase family protein
MKIVAKNVWFTSDSHFGHTNICRGVSKWNTGDEEEFNAATRNFPDLETMNEHIVENINNCVGENDWLIHLGDFSFGGIENIEVFRSQIKCKNIVLIIGNHDHHIENNKDNVRKHFRHVAHYEELDVTVENRLGANKHKFVLCHYPIVSWNNMPRGAFMLHGHQHLKGDSRFGEGRRMDVGMCGSPEFRPYHINEVLDILSGSNSRERPSRDEK